MREYRHGRKFNGFFFCGICGIHTHQNLYGPPQDESWPEKRKEFVRRMLDIKPLNVRIFEEVDLNNSDVKRLDEGTDGYEATVLGL